MYKVLIAVISVLAVLSAKTDDFTGTHGVTTDEFTDFVEEAVPKKINDGHPYITSANKICECSIFNTFNPSLDDKPIMLQSNTRVDNCDSASEIACSKFCVELAFTVPKCLCDILGHHNDLKYLYSRICDSETWTPTGYFCHKHEMTSCSYGNFPTLIMIYIVLCKYLVMFLI